MTLKVIHWLQAFSNAIRRTLKHFHCVTACSAMYGIAIAILSVRLSVRLSDACIVTKLNVAL